jgi:AraC-like DNA-binding protein
LIRKDHNGQSLFDTHLIGPECRERFLPILANGPLMQLGVMLAGVSDLRSQYYIGRTNSKFLLFLGTLSGKAKLTLENETKEIKPGDLLIAPTGTTYRYELIDGRPWNILWFHLKNKSDYAKHEIEIRSIDFLSKFQTEIDDILRESSIQSFLSMEARHAKECYLSILLQRILRPESNSLKTRYEKQLAELWREVAEHPAHSWTLEIMAEKVGYSAGHLNRLCREYYGRPAVKQLAYIRMEYAMQLIIQGNLKIKNIATMCGYENEFAFSVAFKRRFGFSPGRLWAREHKDIKIISSQ